MSEPTVDERTYFERSRTGELQIELDSDGFLSVCQLAPSVMTWSADQLAERFMVLHRLALMRALADKRLGSIERGAFQDADDVWVVESDITAYRAAHLNF